MLNQNIRFPIINDFPLTLHTTELNYLNKMMCLIKFAL